MLKIARGAGCFHYLGGDMLTIAMGAGVLP